MNATEYAEKVRQAADDIDEKAREAAEQIDPSKPWQSGQPIPFAEIKRIMRLKLEGEISAVVNFINAELLERGLDDSGAIEITLDKQPCTTVYSAVRDRFAEAGFEFGAREMHRPVFYLLGRP